MVDKFAEMVILASSPDGVAARRDTPAGRFLWRTEQQRGGVRKQFKDSTWR